MNTTETSITTDELERLTLGENSIREINRNAYLISLNNEPATFATNNVVCVVVKDALPGVAVANGFIEGQIKRLIATMPPATEEWDLTALRSWCGDAQWPYPCSCDNGDRTCECCGITSVCPKCEGYGEVSPEPAPGYIGKVKFDRSLVAQALTFIRQPFAGVACVPVQRIKGSVLWIVGDDAIASIASMHEDEKTDWPRLEDFIGGKG